ncbi:MAG: leucine-rich repeat domain-containing protein [Oscillospiraceae bacterium]|nr:leucine-rich repeat domain-containing protein [Oscillospiraceae bacterium]
MKKKILAVFVCAATVLSLAGCGNNEQSAPVNTSSITSQNPDRSTSSTSEMTSSVPQSDTSSDSEPESSVPSQPAANEKDYKWTVSRDGYGNETIFGITYKGSDENVIFPETLGGIPISSVSGFNGNIDLKSVTIPASIDKIDNNAFGGCLNLTEVIFLGDVPDFTLDSFKGTPWLEVRMAENTTPGLTIIDNVLVAADKEIISGDVVVPDGIVRICSSAFWECSKITSISIPDSVTKIGKDAFFNCSNMTSVTLPKGLTEINNGVFSCCDSLKSVDIPYGVTTIGDQAFSMCHAVVNVPETVKDVTVSHISTAIFKGKRYEYCEYSREFWDDVKQNAIMMEFEGKDFIITDNILMKINPNATKIELPDSVAGIDDNVAERCKNDVIITFKGKNYNIKNLDKLKADISAA